MVAAQTATRHELAEAEWVNDVTLAAANSVIAGLVAGLRRSIAGGEFWPAARQGAVGGLAIYAGKRTASWGNTGSLWLSRQVSAVGVAISGNAAEGLAPFARLYFPIGPAALELDRTGAQMHWGVSVNVRDLMVIGYSVNHPDLTLNWGESLATGSPVFEAKNGFLLRDGSDGSAVGGVVYIEAADERLRSDILKHEVVHVIQHEVFNRLVGNPLERWTLEKLPGDETVPSWLRLGLLQLGWYWSLDQVGLGERYRRPLELEAQWVEYH